MSEHYNSHYVICPYCDFESEDDVSQSQLEPNVPVSWTCEKCEREFKVQKRVLVRFDNWPDRAKP